MKQEEYFGRMFIKKCFVIEEEMQSNMTENLINDFENRLDKTMLLRDYAIYREDVLEEMVRKNIDWMYWPWAYERYLELKEKYKWTNNKQ